MKKKKRPKRTHYLIQRALVANIPPRLPAYSSRVPEWEGGKGTAAAVHPLAGQPPKGVQTGGTIVKVPEEGKKSRILHVANIKEKKWHGTPRCTKVGHTNLHNAAPTCVILIHERQENPAPRRQKGTPMYTCANVL